jgi:hypothetical protein
LPVWKSKPIGAVSGYITNQRESLKRTPDKSLKLYKWLNTYDGDYSPGSVSPSGIFIKLNAMEPFRKKIRLRASFILSSLRSYIIASLILLTVYKSKRSVLWFARASGYIVGALRIVEISNE